MDLASPVVTYCGHSLLLWVTMGLKRCWYSAEVIESGRVTAIVGAEKSSATPKFIISLCNLCGSLCLYGEITPKTFTTEAQRPLRSHREGSPNAARNLFQQPALESLRYKWSPRRLPGAKL